jgi:hypothetical protein
MKRGGSSVRSYKKAEPQAKDDKLDFSLAERL